VADFEISTNQFDQIFRLKTSEHGVWLSVRGSSIIQLYDDKDFSCKLIIDVTTNHSLYLNKVWFLNESHTNNSFYILI
jgi:hypothetical protein